MSNWAEVGHLPSLEPIVARGMKPQNLFRIQPELLKLNREGIDDDRRRVEWTITAALGSCDVSKPHLAWLECSI